MRDYEVCIVNYFVCKFCFGKPMPGDNVRWTTEDERKQESCCATKTGSEYYGASARSWSCGRSPDFVVILEERQEV